MANLEELRYNLDKKVAIDLWETMQDGWKAKLRPDVKVRIQVRQFGASSIVW